MEPSGIEAYALGRSYEMMPIGMVADACHEVPAGPVTFIVEARHLHDDVIIETAESQGKREVIDEPTGVDDSGPTLHVVGTEDRLEYLRFDCFDNEPHYHYIHNAAGSNTVVRIDTHAEGDPKAWTMARVAERLPEMLEHADGAPLAAAVRAAPEQVHAVLDDVAQLLEQAELGVASA